MPIIEAVNEVLFDGKSAKEAVADLMLRDKNSRKRKFTVVGIFRTENSVR